MTADDMKALYVSADLSKTTTLNTWHKDYMHLNFLSCNLALVANKIMGKNTWQ